MEGSEEMTPTAIRVSADHVADGKVAQSGWGEIVVSLDGECVVLVADANWQCDRFSMTPTTAILLGDALHEAARRATGCVEMSRIAPPALGTTDDDDAA